jgi:hypothetical protein
VKASQHIASIELLFNEALAQYRIGLNPRAGNLAHPSATKSPATKIPNVFGGYNLVSQDSVEAVIIPEQFARGVRIDPHQNSSFPHPDC